VIVTGLHRVKSQESKACK